MAMKTIDDALPYFGKNVTVHCTDGYVASGKFALYESHADLDEDEPEIVSLLQGTPGDRYYRDIPVQKIESIEIVPEDLDDLDDDF